MNPSLVEPPPPLCITCNGRRSSNLFPGLFLLPRKRRTDAFLFHDFCRHIDDVAEDRMLSDTEKKRILSAWLPAMEPAYETDLPADFLEMLRRRDLDRRLLSEIVRGVLMDTDHSRYKTIEELLVYCRRVASAVGLVSARIFGASGREVESYAEQLGIALQLTNILRDVAEDATMGRIYLPLEDLERFGVTEEDIFRGRTSPSMIHLLNHQAERADSWFAKAEISWSEMSPNQRRLMRPARFMSAIYRDILLQMHRDRYDVFAIRYRVSAFKKLLLLLQVMTSKS